MISGNVQGVGYREFVQTQATKLKIEGTVHNAPEGKVVIYVCGLSEDLDNLIDVLYKGPEKSKVENIEAEPLVIPKDFRGVFRVIGFE
jgi:acylphosphatase